MGYVDFITIFRDERLIPEKFAKLIAIILEINRMKCDRLKFPQDSLVLCYDILLKPKTTKQ